MADDELIEFATRLFGLARAGQTEQLAAYLDAGVDANLANQKGDTLVMLAAYHGHAETVRALLERGADPARGCGVQGRGRGRPGARRRRRRSTGRDAVRGGNGANVRTRRLAGVARHR